MVSTGMIFLHLRLARRIPDAGGSAADQRDGPVTGPLQVRHEHELLQVPDMEALRRGIEPDVERDPL